VHGTTGDTALCGAAGARTASGAPDRGDVGYHFRYEPRSDDRGASRDT